MFKTVSLPDETWTKIVRRLTAEVGADDALHANFRKSRTKP